MGILPSREVLAIFGLGMGEKTAIKASLSLLRNAPVAGAVIAASSNAVMMVYLLPIRRQALCS